MDSADTHNDMVLNSLRVWNDRVDSNVLGTVQFCKSLLNKVVTLRHTFACTSTHTYATCITLLPVRTCATCFYFHDYKRDIREQRFTNSRSHSVAPGRSHRWRRTCGLRQCSRRLGKEGDNGADLRLELGFRVNLMFSNSVNLYSTRWRE